MHHLWLVAFFICLYLNFLEDSGTRARRAFDSRTWKAAPRYCITVPTCGQCQVQQCQRQTQCSRNVQENCKHDEDCAQLAGESVCMSSVALFHLFSTLFRYLDPHFKLQSNEISSFFSYSIYHSRAQKWKLWLGARNQVQFSPICWFLTSTSYPSPRTIRFKNWDSLPEVVWWNSPPDVFPLRLQEATEEN